MPDFTNCKQIRRAYNGANGNKIAISYEGKQYMLKFPAKGKPEKTDLTYTNGCISEYIGSKIFQSVGFETQNTVLGTYRLNGKLKTVCACEDFATNGWELADFINIENSIIDSNHKGTNTDIEEIEDCIQKQTFVDPQKLSDFYWDMFVIDALIANPDRHNGNWGVLNNISADESKIAPVYDCGSSLLPQADDIRLREIMSRPEEMEKRIFVFPTSQLKADKQKINYYDFMTSTDHEPYLNAVVRTAPKINMASIDEIIETTPYISDVQKEFYHMYLHERNDKIIQPAYQHALEYNEEKIHDNRVHSVDSTFESLQRNMKTSSPEKTPADS